jgi:hypothetical protein
MNSTHSGLAVSVLAAGATFIASAHADTYTEVREYLPGTLCHALNETDAACIARGVWGVGNTCSDAVTVTCPHRFVGTQSSGGSVPDFGASIKLDVFDRSGIADVTCSLYLTNPTTQVIDTISKHTIGFSSNVMTINLTDNVHDSNLTTFATIECSIPGFVPGIGFSHVAAIRTAEGLEVVGP